MSDLKNVASSLAIKYRTGSLPLHSRREWLREMISKEYTKIEVSAPSNVQLLDETTIYPRQQLRLSTVRSHGVKIDRLKMEPYSPSHVKLYVEQHLTDINLSPKKVAEAAGLSQRYINMLFEAENTSLMRYVLSRRLQR